MSTNWNKVSAIWTAVLGALALAGTGCGLLLTYGPLPARVKDQGAALKDHEARIKALEDYDQYSVSNQLFWIRRDLEKLNSNFEAGAMSPGAVDLTNRTYLTDRIKL